MKFSFVIVGAGLSGCIVAEKLANAYKNEHILIIEQRSHIAGNCYDYRDENNILIQKYGPHIFHTNSIEAWNYLSNFTEWEYYVHKVLAEVNGEFVPVPFNLNSLHKSLPANLAMRIEAKLLDKYGFGLKIPILQMQQENTDNDMKFLANFIYEKIFYGYTLKQWGMLPEDLNHSVMERVPFFISRDDRYFQDIFQGVPKYGYTKMIEKMINKPNIHVMLNTDYADIKSQIDYKTLIYTGKIDSFFDYRFSYLPYRDLYFKLATYDVQHFQEVAQINYPSINEFTRITEFSHFYSNTPNLGRTVVAHEFAISHVPEAKNSPYYPIPTKSNEQVAQKYFDEAKKLNNVLFLGRLADYKYYNMDQAVLRALDICDNILNEKTV